ncbi:MAG: hypothetical protein U0401_02250 [Anaerolineae bacterium]
MVIPAFTQRRECFLAGDRFGPAEKEVSPSSPASSAVFPNNFSGIIWNKQHLLACKPGEELLVYLYDQS